MEPPKKKIRVLRASHVFNMYFHYIDKGKVPERYDKHHEYDFPILVTSFADDICAECRAHPTINFCGKSSWHKRYDLEIATLIGLSIGREYTPEALTKIFEEEAKRVGAHDKFQKSIYRLRNYYDSVVDYTKFGIYPSRDFG